MYVFNNETLKYFIKKLKEKLVSKAELDNKVDKVSGKYLTDVDFTDGAIDALEKKYDILNTEETTDYVNINLQSSDLQTSTEINLKNGCDIFIYPIFNIEKGYVFINSNNEVEIPYTYIAKKKYEGSVVLTITGEGTDITQTHDLSNIESSGKFIVNDLELEKSYKLKLTAISDNESFKSNFYEETITVKEYHYIFDFSCDVDHSTLNLFKDVADAKMTYDYCENGLIRYCIYINNNNSEFASGIYNITTNNKLRPNIVGVKKVPSAGKSLKGFLINSPSLLYGLDYAHNNITTMYEMCMNSYLIEKTMPVGINVTNMYQTYKNCYNLIGPIVCGPNVTNMVNTYCNCWSLTGSPICGSNVTNMSGIYYNCRNLTGTPVCENNVIDMSYAYSGCNKLTGSPVHGPNVTNISYAYYSCKNLTGSPVCGPNITDMHNAYWYCSNLTGNPVCGDSVTNMDQAYAHCINLTGPPVHGSNVTNMYYTYFNCSNITGSFYCGDNVVNMGSTFRYCYNLKGPVMTGKNVNSLDYTFAGCTNLRNVYVLSNNVTYCRGMCDNRSGLNFNSRINIYTEYGSTTWSTLTKNSYMNAVIDQGLYYSSNTINSSNGQYCKYNDQYGIYIYSTKNVYKTFKINELGIMTYTTDDTNLRPKQILHLQNGYESDVSDTTVSIYKNSVDDIVTYIDMSNSPTLKSFNLAPSSNETLTSMYQTFDNCFNLTSPPICGSNVTNMAGTYRNCHSLTQKSVCGDKVTNMAHTYDSCFKLLGNPVCGPNVINMANAYCNCTNLTGSPVCGPNVTDMSNAYYNCYRIVDSPVCGDNVINMSGAYYNCFKLTGYHVCGPNVTDMNMTYYNCTGLTSPSIVNKNVQTLYQTFKDCVNLHGNVYIASNKVNKADYCFNGRSSNNRLNIYIPTIGYSETANSLNTFLATSESISIVGTNINWEYDSSNKYYYNTYCNIYIYPKEEDILKVYKDNELLIARYKMKAGTNVMPVLTNITCYKEDETDQDGSIIRSLYCNKGYKFNYGISFTGITDLLEVHSLRLDYVNTAHSMFSSCTDLTYINAANIVTNNIRSMDYMFASTGISQNSFVNVNWNTSKVNTANYIFWNCRNL